MKPANRIANPSEPARLQRDAAACAQRFCGARLRNGKDFRSHDPIHD